MKKILIIAGEASSDSHAASLVKAIKNIKNGIEFFGLGGADMQNAGVDILYDIVNLAVIGPVDLIKNYSKLKEAYDGLCARIKKDPPDAAILIDYPGFNLKVAKDLKKLNVPIIYYISPQIWAWGMGRIKKMRNLVDKMLVLFKFEEVLYKKENINVSFVGHPLLDIAKPTKEKDQILTECGLSPDKITVGILPGSRVNELNRILPIMAKAAGLLQDRFGVDKIQFLLPVAKTLKMDSVKEILAKSNINIRFIETGAYDALSACKVAMVASGTATLETALLGVPMAIVYKVAFIMYWLTRMVIKIPYIGMVNVISQKKVIPEFIQNEARPELIADYLASLINDKNAYGEMKGVLRGIKEKLGAGGASARTAKEIISFLEKT